MPDSTSDGESRKKYCLTLTVGKKNPEKWQHFNFHELIREPRPQLKKSILKCKESQAPPRKNGTQVLTHVQQSTGGRDAGTIHMSKKNSARFLNGLHRAKCGLAVEYRTPESTDTEGDCTHIQGLLQGPPLNAHKKDREQSRRPRETPLIV